MGVMLLFAIVVFFCALGKSAAKDKRRKEAYEGFRPTGVLGGAKFADYWMIWKAGLFKGKGIPIGHYGWREMHYDGKGHLLSIMSARIGKGLMLITALLSWGQSVICVDPKAENALVTAKFRRRLGKTFLLNPFRMFPAELGSMYARYNPMMSLNPASSAFHAQTDKIAAALIFEEGKENRYFSDGGRILVSGVIASIRRHEAPELQNLVEVARVISSGPELFTFCRNAMTSTDPFIIQKLQRFAIPAGKEPSKEMDAVISTAITNLGFISSAAIAESLSGSDFRFADLKKKTATVFICLPLATLDVTEKYFRLILESALTELLNEGAK